MEFIKRYHISATPILKAIWTPNGIQFPPKLTRVYAALEESSRTFSEKLKRREA